MTKIRKALIPIAGHGLRMGPICSAVPKAMLPLPCTHGRLRPMLHHICAEAKAADIEQVGLIVSPGTAAMVEGYLAAAGRADEAGLPAAVELIVQDHPRGFGDAVACGRDFVGGEAFVLLLGDHVRVPDAGKPCCVAQVIRAAETSDAETMIGVQVVGAEELAAVGVVAGQPAGERLYRCTAMVEKPDLATARTALRTDGLAEDRFLAHAGIFVFTSEVFARLATLAACRGEEELELTTAQQALLRDHPGRYLLYRVAGRTMDTGTPAAYIHTFEAMSSRATQP